MKALITISLSIILSTFSVIGSTKAFAGDNKNLPYEICTCDFSGCLGKRTTQCAAITKCTKVTEQQFSNALNNKSSVLLMIDSKAFCVDPRQFYLKN